MPCVPRIDQPCPLSREARRSLDVYCGHCSKTVHSLDGMDEAQRRALLRSAGGPICVSYRVSAGLGAAALALTLAVTPVQAGTPVTPSAGQGVLQPSPRTQPLPGTVSTASGLLSPASSAPQQASEPPECEEEELLEIIVGGISRPDDAEWLEQESDLPELPMRDAPGAPAAQG